MTFKNIFNVFFTIVFTLLLGFWMLQFAFSFRAFVLETSIQGFNFDERAVKTFIVYGVLSGLIFLLMPLNDYLNGTFGLIEQFRKYLQEILKYGIFFLELAVGLYITQILFTFEYSGFDPRLIFLLGGFVLFIVLERVKGWLLSFQLDKQNLET